MNTTPDLFTRAAESLKGCSPILRLPAASHNRDPVTSYRAEPKANIKGQALTLLRLLREHGPCTMRELSRASGFCYWTAQKRISVLANQRKPLARVTRIRPCLVTGNDCQEWIGI